MRRISAVLLLTLLLISGIHASNFADYYNLITGLESLTGDLNTGTTVFPLLRIPSGGKAEAMGTAQVAVAADSASVLYNPAASSVLDLTELAFLHNNWIADTSVESVMFTKRFKDFGIGTGIKLLYLPFTQYDDWAEPVETGYPLETILTLNASYNLFRNYYFSGLSAGLSVKGGFRRIPNRFYANQSSFAVMADAGLYTSFNFLKFYDSRDRNLSVGAVFRNAGVETLGEALPAEFSAGFAYSPIRPVNIAVDFVLPVNLLGAPAEKFYFAGGFDAAMTDFFSFQGGFNYRGSNPRISLGSTINTKDAAFNLNYTLDMTTATEQIDRFSIEARLKLGDEGRFENMAMVDELYIAGLEAYANGDLSKAIAYWEAALEIDNTFTPAEEYIASAARSMDLLQRMQELNTVE
jgi:hypothetical protein